jgi:hypothetical protein
MKLVVKLQSMWRGHRDRQVTNFLKSTARVCVN